MVVPFPEKIQPYSFFSLRKQSVSSWMFTQRSGREQELGGILKHFHSNKQNLILHFKGTEMGTKSWQTYVGSFFLGLQEAAVIWSHDMATPLEPAMTIQFWGTANRRGKKKRYWKKSMLQEPTEGMYCSNYHAGAVSVTQRQHYHSPTHISMPSPAAVTVYSWSHSLLSTFSWLTVPVPGQGTPFDSSAIYRIKGCYGLERSQRSYRATGRETFYQIRVLKVLSNLSLNTARFG